MKLWFLQLWWHETLDDPMTAVLQYQPVMFSKTGSCLHQRCCDALLFSYRASLFLYMAVSTAILEQLQVANSSKFTAYWWVRRENDDIVVLCIMPVLKLPSEMACFAIAPEVYGISL